MTCRSMWASLPTAQSNGPARTAGRGARGALSTRPRRGLCAALIALAACGGEAEAPPAAPAAADAPAAPSAPAAPAAPAASAPSASQAPTLYEAVIVRRYPHDETAFTQGLFVADGDLYESTGQRGASRLRRLDLDTGAVLDEAALPDHVFGEGSTRVGDRILVLSWQAGQGFVHDAATLDQEGAFDLAGEGWGLAYDEDAHRLIVSDGTSTLRFLDPDTYAQTGAVRVTVQGRPVRRLNELEWVPGTPGAPGAAGEGRLLANVWQRDFIMRIDPDTGVVDGVIDVSGLFPEAERVDPVDDVPNGIAYDPGTGRLFLTGKRWPTLFEVELRERS